MIETYRGAVYPWHCDHMGHTNVMWYVGEFDEATWNLFAEIGVSPASLKDKHRAMAAVQQNITCKRELLSGDVSAVCVITAVHMDSNARKSTAFPPDFVARGKDMLCSYEIEP